MSVTFRSLGGAPPQRPPPRSALGEWYAGVEDTPIEELQIGDLCRALRQGLFVEHLVPVALERLRLDEYAGDVFDSELASVLARLPREFWEANKAAAADAREVFALFDIAADEGIRVELAAFTKTPNTIAAIHSKPE